tara:strand:- start:390 stop:566 length:177 start_codon:yes stop_codon:yes gene_type:complete
MRLCYRCKTAMNKKIISDKEVIKNIIYICPACKCNEEDYDVSNSKFSAWSELDVIKEA